MTWEEICANPILADTPYRVESDKWGNIVMSPPAGAEHSDAQSDIVDLLKTLLPHGRAQTEFPLLTSEGVKAIDAVWLSRDRRRQRPAGSIVYTEAPQICVEIRSPSNSHREIMEKLDLYFEKGAQECWMCDRAGKMTFFSVNGHIPRSILCPDFPVGLPKED